MNPYYQIYRNKTVALVGSLIVKLSPVADKLNAHAEMYGYPTSTDKNLWRYYMHLAGEYHPADEPMTITSLDDGTEIIFDKTVLSLHKKTRSVFNNTPAYVKELMIRYPIQANLVRGILNPIPKEQSIAAEECAILYYDRTLVETQELSIISDMERAMRSYMYRYMMESLAITDEYFVAVKVADMFAQLVPWTIALRNGYVHTAQAHSFYIRMYLASHSHLDEFMPYLTLDQMMYLYRNVNYLESNVGKQSTHDDLVTNLMTARSIPVYEYRLKHKSIDLENTTLQPAPVFVREQVNLSGAVENRNVDEWPIADIIRKEVPSARDNFSYVDNYITEATNDMAKSSISNLPTKILEAAAVDPEDLQPYKLNDVLINEFIHLAADGKYIGNIEIMNPVSGATMKLSIKDAFVLFLYSYYVGKHDVALVEVPTVLAIDVAKFQWIPDDEYRSLLPDNPWGRWDDDIDYFMDGQYELPNPITTPEDFMELCQDVLERKRARYEYVYRGDRLPDIAARHALFNHSYTDIHRSFATSNYSTYAEFFRYIGLDVEEMIDETWLDLAHTTLDAATHFETEGVISLREIQSAMVRLFKRLSSYTIQFIETITSTDSAVADPNTLGYEVVFGDELSEGMARLPAPVVDDISGFVTGTVETELPIIEVIDLADNMMQSVFVGIGLEVSLGSMDYYRGNVILPIITILEAEDITS